MKGDGRGEQKYDSLAENRFSQNNRKPRGYEWEMNNKEKRKIMTAA